MTMQSRLGARKGGRVRAATHVLLALLATAGCRFVSTPIGRVLAHPHRHQGTEITVAGRVEAVRWVAETGAVGFRLVDGSDSLLVLTLEPAPPAGRRARLQGHFIRNFPLAGGARPVLLYKTGANGGRISSTVDVR
jgi:hypothetical protein